MLSSEGRREQWGSYGKCWREPSQGPALADHGRNLVFDLQVQGRVWRCSLGPAGEGCGGVASDMPLERSTGGEMAVCTWGEQSGSQNRRSRHFLTCVAVDRAGDVCDVVKSSNKDSVNLRSRVVQSGFSVGHARRVAAGHSAFLLSGEPGTRAIGILLESTSRQVSSS